MYYRNNTPYLHFAAKLLRMTTTYKNGPHTEDKLYSAVFTFYTLVQEYNQDVLSSYKNEKYPDYAYASSYTGIPEEHMKMIEQRYQLALDFPDSEDGRMLAECKTLAPEQDTTHYQYTVTYRDDKGAMQQMQVEDYAAVRRFHRASRTKKYTDVHSYKNDVVTVTS